MALRMSRPEDALHEALDQALRRRKDEGLGVVGYGIAHLLDGDGKTVALQPFTNIITDTGDAYYAQKAIVAINSNGVSAPTALTGMQIGAGSTAAAKNGSGAALVSWLAGQAFDATFPSNNSLGAGNGVQAVYKCTYAAGTGTGSVQEATITNTATLGTASNAGNTISRVVFTAITKNSSDSLAITWQHLFKG